MPSPFVTGVILKGREWKFEYIQYFKRIFQKLIVCRNLCEIYIQRKKELFLSIIAGDDISIVFQCIIKASGHAGGSVSECEVKPCRKLAVSLKKQ